MARPGKKRSAEMLPTSVGAGMTRTSLVLMSTLAACSGEGAELDLADRDPRCVAACPETMPEYDGAGEVCDSASRAQCLDECEARIAGVSSLCQSCLVENACFDPGGCFSGDGPSGTCLNDTCTISSQFGTCSFNVNDQAAKLRCYQQVDPRREVACTAEFQPTTECAMVCP